MKDLRYFLWAAWFGLVTGLVEVALLAAAKFGLDREVHSGLEVIWLAPLADTVLFFIPAIILLLLSFKLPEQALTKAAIGVFIFLGFLSILLMYQRLHIPAAALLAAGLAAQSSRLISRYFGFWEKVVRYSFLPLVLVVAGAAILISGSEWLAETRAVRELPKARADAPNVLLIVMDTVRARDLSLYGYNRPTTPNLEKLARTGVAFDRSFSTASWTLPSHSTMFTGRFPHELSVDWHRPLDATYPTLAEEFRNSGYVTGGFVANVDVCSAEGGLARGFTHYEDYVFSAGELFRSSTLARILGTNVWLQQLTHHYELLGRRTVQAINENFLSWVSSRDGRPFFAFLNYFDAHIPYLPSQPYDRMFGSGVDRFPLLMTNDPWKGNQIDAEISAYDGAIAQIDHEIGELLNELERQDVLKNTLVVITADHGEEFGEHGLFGHGNSLYTRSVHVPLLISFPGRVPGHPAIEEPVSLRDLAATIATITDLPARRRFPGSSLSRFWDNSQANVDAESPVLSEVRFAKNLPAWFPVSKGDMKSLIYDKWHYIVNGDGVEELYDLEADPLEARDLAKTDMAAPVLQHLRESLKRAAGQEIAAK